MRTYRFTWKAFPPALLEAIAARYGLETKGKDVAEVVGAAFPRPTDDLVREIKDDLVAHWIPTYAGAEEIVERLREWNIGPGGSPRSGKGYAEYIAHSRNAKTLRWLLLDAMRRFGDEDLEDDERRMGPLDVRRFARILPKDQPEDERPPLPHQIEAWNAMSAHLADAESSSRGSFRGLLVMPTGAGKTFTAVRWLVENVIARGQRVVWIAHRYELLEQTAKEFYKQIALLSDRSDIDHVRVRLVSGRHCTVTAIDPADHVVIVNVASASRKLDRLAELLADKRTFLVIDEAHHGTAKSYRDLVQALDSGGRVRLLGLTATPTRTAERERAHLSRIFGNNIIYQVALRTLIERKQLARPMPVEVKTNMDAEAGLTAEDVAHFQKFHDISEEWAGRIAEYGPRNEVIVSHYIEHRTRYGRTLIFAIDIDHAALLAERLREAGVRANYVASHRVDGTDGDNKAIIEDFRKGRLDVLTNVMIMTEGVDVPEVQTVFLTRPTQSEILMRQMIGRALRGPAAGGSEVAFLVAFEDQWRTHANWERPLDLVPDIIDAADLPESTPRDRGLVEHLPWEFIRSVAAAIRARGFEYSADAFEAIPIGSFVVELLVEDEYVLHIVPVYKHHEVWWETLFSDLGKLSPEERASLDLQAKYDDVFADCDAPLPSFEHFQHVVAGFIAQGKAPEFESLEGRHGSDPTMVARQIVDGDFGPKRQAELVERSYTSLARAIYPSLREYRAAVDDAVFETLNPDVSTQRPITRPYFGAGPTNPLTAPPIGQHAYDLAELLDEVQRDGVTWLGLEDTTRLPGAPTIEWTKRPVKSWFGMAHYEMHTGTGEGRIRINVLLDSPDVARDTLKHLIWHEYLHLYLKTGHPPEFRERERRFPGHAAADREMETLHERFEISFY